MNIVLASKSPQRKRILEDNGFSFIVDVSSVDEDAVKTKTNDVKELVMALAKLKGEEIAKRHEDSIIIAADTMVSFEGEHIGQQETEENAEKTIRKLMGKTHEVYSGLWVFNTGNGKLSHELDLTHVTLRKVSDETLREYIASGQYKGKAAAYNIDDPEFESFVENVEGSPTNVGGLPIEKVKKMIEKVK